MKLSVGLLMASAVVLMGILSLDWWWFVIWGGLYLVFDLIGFNEQTL